MLDFMATRNLRSFAGDQSTNEESAQELTNDQRMFRSFDPSVRDRIIS